jgi:hypothetical protein
MRVTIGFSLVHLSEKENGIESLGPFANFFNESIIIRRQSMRLVKCTSQDPSHYALIHTKGTAHNSNKFSIFNSDCENSLRLIYPVIG